MAAAARISDKAFAYDEARLERMATEKPWLAEPKYFTTTMVAASAAMKMLQHAQTGVERGMSRNPPVPIEIMGLMIGHADPDDKHVLVVTDAFPLPVEGTETSVIADNPKVNEYMSRLVDSIETVRKDRLIGWYHSHPFDVREHPNWFFSMVDVQTQNMWQHMFERSGSKSDPFFGIVVDPLRAIAKGRPEMGAFRNFPPSYKPSNKRLGPDGKIWPSEAAMAERWGPAAMSYYSLEIQFFQTTLSRRVLDVLAREHLWARVLASTSNLDRESRESTAHRVSNLAEMLAAAEAVVSMRRGGGMRTGGDSDAMASVATAAADVSAELLQGQASQVVKYTAFARVGAGDEAGDAKEDEDTETGMPGSDGTASAAASSSSSSSSAASAGK